MNLSASASSAPRCPSGAWPHTLPRAPHRGRRRHRRPGRAYPASGGRGHDPPGCPSCLATTLCVRAAAEQSDPPDHPPPRRPCRPHQRSPHPMRSPPQQRPPSPIACAPAPPPRAWPAPRLGPASPWRAPAPAPLRSVQLRRPWPRRRRRQAPRSRHRSAPSWRPPASLRYSRSGRRRTYSSSRCDSHTRASGRVETTRRRRASRTWGVMDAGKWAETAAECRVASALRTARSGWHQTDTREECQSIGGDQPSDQCAPIELRVESVQRNVGPRRPQRLLVLLFARDTLLSGLVVRAAAALAPRDPLLLLPLLALELARLVPRLALARGRPRVRARPALWRRAPPSELIKSLAGWRAPPPPAPRRRPAPSIAAGRAVTPRRAVPLRRRAAPSSSVASVAHLLVALR